MPGSISSLSTLEAPSVRYPWFDEKADQQDFSSPRTERILTPDGAPAEFDQPAIPKQNRIFGNPTPLGLLSWGYGVFLLSSLTFRVQGLQTLSAAIPPLIFFGGISQTFCAWWEMSLGNTYMATLFGIFGAFSFSVGCSLLPIFGLLSSERDAGLGLVLLSFMMLFTLVLLGSLKCSLNLIATVAGTMLFSLFLGAHHISGATHDGLRNAAGAFGMIATAASWWTAVTNLWTADVTFLKSPVVVLYSGDRGEDMV